MALNPRQLKQLERWFHEKDVNPRCPSCGFNQWAVGEIVAPMTFEASGAMAVGGNVVPVVQLICGKCAYVRSYAAVPIGLLSEEPLTAAK